MEGSMKVKDLGKHRKMMRLECERSMKFTL